jgi:hypothetical protein
VIGSGTFTVLDTEAMFPIGPVRLDPAGGRLAYEFGGLHVLSLDGAHLEDLGTEMDGLRSPAFALDGAAIVYTTDGGDLRVHTIGTNTPDEVIPSTWKYVYSPDWSPAPAFSCAPLTTCL